MADEHKCLSCKFAKWDRTVTGRLHPDASGQCTYVVPVPPIPACMYRFGSDKPSGGFITRRPGKHLHATCPTWEPV